MGSVCLPHCKMGSVFLQHCKSLLAEMRKTKREPLMCDLRLVCSGGEEVLTSTLLLASVSPLLHTSLSSAGGEALGPCVLLPDIPAQHLNIFIDKLLSWQAKPSNLERDILRRICSLLCPPVCVEDTSYSAGEHTVLLDQTRAELDGDGTANKPEEENKQIMLPAKPKKFSVRTIYQCDQCQKQFDLKRNFMHHINSHLGIKPYVCKLCNKGFTQKSHLNTHTKIHLGAKPYICHKCGKAFSVNSNLKKHYSLHCRDQEEAEAAEDDARPQGTLHYLTEVLEEDGVSDQLAPSEDKEEFFIVEETYQENYRPFVEGGTESYPSHKVESFSSGVVVPQVESFSCSPCNKSYSSKSGLSLHLGSHGGAKPFPCDSCSKSFTQKSHLNHHIKVKHSDGVYLKKFECDLCSRRLTSSYSLKKHKMLHWNEKPFECQVCQKRFVQNSHLELHLQKHTGERPHLCVECGKSFATKGHLKDHSRFHTGERKVYQCVECSAEYFGLHDLKVHMRKHSGELPFPCDHCAKRFRSKRNLENHKRVHTGEKPYQCAGCGRAFSTSSALCQHLKKIAACRTRVGDTSGAYKPKLSESENSAASYDLKSCIILETLELNLPTVEINEIREEKIVSSKAEVVVETKQPESTSISLPGIFLAN